VHALEALAVSMPPRSQRAGDGTWHCPPGDAWARPCGRRYQGRAAAQYHPLYIQNLHFLQDFGAPPVPVDPEQEQRGLSLVDTPPGLRWAAATAADPALAVDGVWAFRAPRRLCTDLAAPSLRRPDHGALFRREAAGGQAAQTAARVAEARGAPLLVMWEHRLWQADVHGESVTLRPAVGAAVRLSSAPVQDLLERGALPPGPAATPAPMPPERRAALTRASPKAQHAANERRRQLLASRRREPITVTARSVQRWRAASRHAAVAGGCGSLG